MWDTIWSDISLQKVKNSKWRQKVVDGRQKRGHMSSKVGLSCFSSQVQDIFRFHLLIWRTYDTKYERNTFVGFMIQNLKILRTLNTKCKELEAVWYKVWVKWMIILVGETVTWPLPEQIMERSSRKIKYIASELCTLLIESPVHRFKYAIRVIATAEVAEMHIKTFSFLFCFN